MNNVRRKSLQEVIDQLEELKSTLESLKDEEEEYRDNMPENLQNSNRYSVTCEACDNLEYAVDGIADVISNIESAKE